MKPHATKTDQAAQQDYAERTLQLLCLIAQSLSRIESHLAGSSLQQRSNKIIAFNGGGRQ
jgi:hypothetical protein